MINDDGLKKALKPTGWVRDSVMDAGNYVFTIHQRVASAWTDHASGHDDVQPVFTLAAVTDFLGPGIHYPDCWDTAAYPSVFDALRECSGQFRCQTCAAPEQPTRQVGHVMLTPMQDLLQAKIHGIARGFMNKRTQGYFMHEVRAMLNETLNTSTPDVHATFECEENGVTGSTSAPIKRVEYHDDGSLEVVIDHWPREQPEVAKPPYTYASAQHTECAMCGEDRHTPVRIDRLGGYICLKCIDRELENGNQVPNIVYELINAVAPEGYGEYMRLDPTEYTITGRVKWLAQQARRQLKNRDCQPSVEQEPEAYMCPAGCGCLWRDNKDGSMSLYGSKSQSCDVCEYLPLGELEPVVRLPPKSCTDENYPHERASAAWLMVAEESTRPETITPYDKLVDHYKGVSYESAKPSQGTALYIGWKGWYTSKEGTVWYGGEVIAFDEGEPVIRTIKGNYHLRPTSQYRFSKEVPKYHKAATGRVE